MKKKYCPKCRCEWSIYKFYPNKSKASGLSSWCKSCNIFCSRNHRIANIERYKSNARKWKVQNPERVKAYNKEWKKQNRRYLARAQRIWASRHQEYKERQKLLNAKRLPVWRRNNPSKNHEYRIKRARLLVGGTFTKSQWEEIKRRFELACAMCGLREPLIILTVDHIIPLSKGGANEAANIQPLCRSCNSRKHNKIMK